MIAIQLPCSSTQFELLTQATPQVQAMPPVQVAPQVQVVGQTQVVPPAQQTLQQLSLPATSQKRVPRSTKCYRKRKAAEAGVGPGKTYRPRTEPIVCGQCLKVRDSANHTQYYGSWFCGHTSTVSLDVWRAEMKRARDAKRARAAEKQ